MSEKLKILIGYVIKRWTLARLKNRNDIVRRQTRLRKKLMRHAGQNFPFYKPYLGIEFSSWPIVDKSVMNEAFDSMNMCNLSRETAWRAAEAALQAENTSAQVGELTIGTSTGTSGRRGLFVVSAEERTLWLASILARCVPDFPFVKHRVAVLLATGNSLYDTASASGRLAFCFFDLKKGIHFHLQALQKFEPDILIASPKAVRALADTRIPLRLKHIFTGGEILEQLDVDPIAKWFGVRPRSIYQATEGFLGVACEFGHIHLNEDDMIFEEEPIKNHPHHFVPIITDLRRRTQAMIRYRLNDILVKHEGLCPCGSPLMALSRVEGRSDDVLEFRVANEPGLLRVMPEAIRATILDSDSHILDFQLVQSQNLDLTLSLASQQFEVSRQKAGHALLTYLKSLGVSPTITVSTQELLTEHKEYGTKQRRIMKARSDT